MVMRYRGGSRVRGRGAGAARGLKASAFAIPLCTLVASLVLMAVFGRRLLVMAAAQPVEEASLVPFFIAAASFLVSAAALVIIQTARIAERAVGPERRLIQAIRRVRAGDVGFRVHLRSGDLLVNLADEFNALLDWLNVNPPAGVITGSDVVEVEEMDSVHPVDLDPAEAIVFGLDAPGEAVES